MTESETGTKKRSRAIVSRRRRRGEDPLEVRLSVRFVFGPKPSHAVQMMEDRSVPLVGSVFHARDVIARAFAVLFVKASLSQPRVVRELLPVLWRARTWPRSGDRER